MPISTYVENIETVDENLRDFYKPLESGEGYILNAEPSNGYAIENVDGLKTALGRERTDRKEFEKKYNSLSKQFEGVDLESLTKTQTEFEKLQKQYEELSKLDPESEAAKIAEAKIKEIEEKSSTKLTKQQKEWQKLHETEVGSRDTQISNLTSQLKNLMVDNTATNALAEAGIVPEHLELILPKVTGAMRLEEDDGKLVPVVVDAEGHPRVRSDGQNMTIADLIPEFQAKWPSSFTVQAKKGGGMQPSKPAGGPKPAEMSSRDKIGAGLQELMRQK